MKSRKPPIKVPEKNTKINTIRDLRIKINDIDGVYKDFENYVEGEYGFTREIEGKELLAAVRCYLILRKHGKYIEYLPDILEGRGIAHKPFKHTNHEILAGYLDERYYKGDEISFKEIQTLILTELDRTDTRTHKSYVDALVAKNILVTIPPQYTFYYYKDLPKLSKTEEKALGICLNETQKLILNNIPENGIVVDKLSETTGIKTVKLKPVLEDLVRNNLIWNPVIGKFKLTELGVEAR